jgi:hypothetical protein
MTTKFEAAQVAVILTVEEWATVTAAMRLVAEEGASHVLPVRDSIVRQLRSQNFGQGRTNG